MAGIKNKNTIPEIRVRKALFKKGYRYKINDKKLPGSPDIVLPKYRTVIFVHGCFWHGHSNCMKSIRPGTNVDFWNSKIEENKKRDQLSEQELKKQNWRVIILWDCELKNLKSFNLVISSVHKELQSYVFQINHHKEYE